MRNLLILLYFAFLPISVFCSPELDKLLNQAEIFQKSNKLDRAINLLVKAEALVENDTSYSDYDMISIFEAYGQCYLGKEDYEKSFAYFQKVEVLHETNQVMDPKIKANLWNGYAELFLAKRQYEKAIEYYSKYCGEVKEIYIEDENIEELYVKNMSRIGTCLLRMGKMIEAKDTYIELLKVIPNNRYLKTKYVTHSNLGYSYDELGDYESAIKHWEHCEEINKKLITKETHATNNLGGLYFVTKKDHTKAEFYFKKVLYIIDTHSNANMANYSYAAKNLCTIYFENKEFNKAYKYINIALKSAMDVYGPEFELTNEILSEKGRILMLKGKIKEAEKLFNQANKNLSIDPHDRRSYENIPYTPQLFNVILHQSKAYLELYERVKDVKALKQSNFLSDVNIDIINSARSSLSNTDSKAALMNAASAVFQVKIKILELLYSETKNKQYVNDAFELIEKTNNFILLETVLKNNDTNRLGLPQEIFDQENSLKTKLAEAESSLYEKQVYTSNDTIGIKADEKIVANCKSEYRSFLKELKKSHSKYFNLNYSDDVVSIDQLQQNFLSEDQTLIHYYISEEEIHCIAITKEAVDFINVPNTSQVIANVKTLREGILKAHKNRNSISGLEELNAASHDLYNTLIKPIKVPLNKKLTIIPMGELSYIPFDILLKTLPEKNAEFYDYEFLLKDHAVSYGYSSTLLYETHSNNVQNKNSANFVGFAPSFNSRKIASNRSELVSLAHNESEVNNISEITGGDIFIEQEATKEKFVDICGGYKILHLATHGVSNSIEGENSYLAFSEDENSMLYAREIYNLNIDSDLVVLSACETAVGELQLGEGVISLARAFTYAGARSNITTLWQVNDVAASLLMQNFYNELKLDFPKDEALRNAKLKYIEKNANEFSHPFYWSAFIPIGDMSAIKIADQTNFYQFGLFGVGGFLMVGLSIYLLKRRTTYSQVAA